MATAHVPFEAIDERWIAIADDLVKNYVGHVEPLDISARHHNRQANQTLLLTRFLVKDSIGQPLYVFQVFDTKESEHLADLGNWVVRHGGIDMSEGQFNTFEQRIQRGVVSRPHSDITAEQFYNHLLDARFELMGEQS